MTLKSSFNLRNKKFYYFIILLIFSILFNQYYGFKGVFPEDSFLTFNSDFIPFKYPTIELKSNT